MNCVRCRGPIELSQKHCGYCGVPLDADHNGVPDAVEQLIADKARATVAADRTREEHGTLVRELTEARAALEKVRRTPRRIWALSRLSAGLIAFLTLFLSVPLTLAVEGLSERSLAGDVLCRFVCEGCSAPARVVFWTSPRSGGRNSGHSRTLCSHPSVRVEWVSNQPIYDWIELPWWQEALFSYGQWCLTGLAVLPFAIAWVERKRLARDEIRLPAQIADLERTLAAAAPPTPSQHYR
jgi:hypothetical protein